MRSETPRRARGVRANALEYMGAPAARTALLLKNVEVAT